MSHSRAFRCIFLMRSLDVGGAQRQLVELARALRSGGIHVTVMTFYPGGAFQPVLERAGVNVVSVNKKGRWEIVGFLRRLVQLIRTERPDVMYSFLSSANLVAALTRYCGPRRLIVWSVRASSLDLSSYDWLVRVELVVCALCSRLADVIICNSRAGYDHLAAKGYPLERMHVVSNGIDCSSFKFDAMARARVRTEWDVQDDDVLVGLVARVDAIKGHADFLAAAALLVSVPQLRFVCVGGGPPEISESLRVMALELGLADRVIWAGQRADIPSVYSALDLFVSASRSEGFSNSVAEAMACERVCVVTDVGDSALLVAEFGCVVPPRDPAALAAAIKELASMPPVGRAQLGRGARQRIENFFSVSRMVDETARLIGVRWSRSGVSAATLTD
jgi:glycosyltransferase involved in cell wall biosynthesis